MTDLVSSFEASTGMPCDLVFSSSGKLTSQIQAGADYDVFVSADKSYPEILHVKGLSEGPPIQYASGSLVAWSKTHLLSKDGFEISDPKFQKIAIANPEIAPYGRAALQALEAMKVLAEVDDRLVYGENISQVNQFVNVGAADIGITGQAVLFALDPKDRGSAVYLPDTLYEEIAQDVVMLSKGASSLKNKERFLEFLRSREAGEILRAYGYQ